MYAYITEWYTWKPNAIWWVCCRRTYIDVHQIFSKIFHYSGNTWSGNVFAPHKCWPVKELIPPQSVILF